ncbi:MAG: hypothetical protein ACTSXK_06220, partial [Promethearchaeota archaeon]
IFSLILSFNLSIGIALDETTKIVNPGIDLDNFYLKYLYKEGGFVLNSTQENHTYEISDDITAQQNAYSKDGIQGWANIFHLYLSYNRINQMEFNCSVDFLLYNNTFQGNLIYNGNENYYYKNDIPTNKIYMPFLVSSGFQTKSHYLISTFNDTGVKYLYTDPEIYQKANYRNLSPYSNIKGDIVTVNVPYPEKCVIFGQTFTPKQDVTYYQFEQNSHFLTETMFPFRSLGIFLENACDDIIEILGGGIFFLMNTNIPIYSMAPAANSEIIYWIISVIAIIGGPTIFTIIWKNHNKKEKKLSPRNKIKSHIKQKRKKQKMF